MTALVRRFPLGSFALLAFAISWTAALAGAPEPLVGCGPLLASLCCHYGLGGTAAVRAHLRRCFDPRMNRPAVLLAIFAPLAILGVALAISGLRQGGWPAWKDPVGAALFVAAANGPGEEPGWRGYALPRLLASHSPLAATGLVAALWIPWHYPMLYARGDFTPLLVAAFSLSLLFGAVWLTVLYRLSGGSVFACMVWHALWNVCAGIGRHVTPSGFPWMGAQVALVALGLLAWQWREMCARSQAGAALPR